MCGHLAANSISPSMQYWPKKVRFFYKLTTLDVRTNNPILQRQVLFFISRRRLNAMNFNKKIGKWKGSNQDHQRFIYTWDNNTESARIEQFVPLGDYVFRVFFEHVILSSCFSIVLHRKSCHKATREWNNSSTFRVWRFNSWYRQQQQSHLNNQVQFPSIWKGFRWGKTNRKSFQWKSPLRLDR